MENKVLTAKQQLAYEFIRSFILRHHYAPTDAEIATGIGIKSRGVAHRYVTALVKAGLIETTPDKRRNICLSDASHSFHIPVIGRIAAGQPIEAIQSHEMLNVNQALLGANRFVLEVQGDSMIGDNICNGDYIICERRDAIKTGDIVVALVDNQEATLKRLEHNSDQTLSLIPSNPTMSPMRSNAEQVSVQGVYIGLLRLDVKQ